MSGHAQADLRYGAVWAGYDFEYWGLALLLVREDGGVALSLRVLCLYVGVGVPT